MTIPEYLDNLNRRYKTGITTEHSFRGDMQQLIESMVPGIMATNEPTHIACGAPDFIITKKNIPLGYIEAKDIDKPLDSKDYKEQFDRYLHSLDNLIITDYLDFRFYKEGKPVTDIRIGKTEGNKIVPIADKLDEFAALIKDFCAYTGQTIRSAEKLSVMMAGKARMLANVIENALNSDEANAADSTLKDQLKAFKDILIHDITAKEFSDIYAQTIAYGMFAARLHDPNLDSFTRQEAAELIPKSNPFLRKLFGYIAGPDIDDRILWIVDALADIFRATDVAALLKNFGKATQQHDPIIHFYETFLAEYDPKLRKARGVWYTPEPVVNFIVRAVDDILKTEFNLPDGLADRSKTKVKVKVFTKATADQRSKVKEDFVEQEVHKVQILDPATGTGTFLAEVVKQVYKKFEGQQGVWSNYVEEHLVPRLNGFELLMASYAMAHLKLDLLLTETGYKPRETSLRGTKQSPQRLRVYLTNSLEEHHPDTGTLFANWLSTEANEANHIKRDTPVMVVLGNPPYSISSTNRGEWIQNLIADYKKNLNERKINIDDDYIKFIRYGQYFIDKNGEGILAYISNNSFIDGITHRQMRRNLSESFDKIYIIDLHGNSSKKEVAPDGGKDENVFDIQQGVSINIFIKTGKRKTNELIKVNHVDFYGKREDKYEKLFKNSISSLEWKNLILKEPYNFFVPKDFSSEIIYSNGFSLSEFFKDFNSGVKTDRDELFIDFNKSEIETRFKLLLSGNYDSNFKKKYNVNDSSSFKLTEKIQRSIYDSTHINQAQYRPFDKRFIYYDTKLVSRPGQVAMKHLVNKDNLGLVIMRQYAYEVPDYCYTFLSKDIIECRFFVSNKGICSLAPLYLYPETNAQKTLYAKQERTPNLNKEIVEKIAQGLGLQFVNEKDASASSASKPVVEPVETTFAPIDLLDYIYAVLHSPSYREKYKEFLKIDFPRVPYPKDANTFWQLVKLGGQLRQIHLLESPVVNKPITKFPVDGDNVVGKVRFVTLSEVEAPVIAVDVT